MDCAVGRVTVPLAAIAGTRNRHGDFDAAFRPQQAHIRDRWVRAYASLVLGDTPPPLALIEVGGVYFVEDGHHRVSTARAYGLAYVDAWVTSLQVCGVLPWEAAPAAGAATSAC